MLATLGMGSGASSVAMIGEHFGRALRHLVRAPLPIPRVPARALLPASYLTAGSLPWCAQAADFASSGGCWRPTTPAGDCFMTLSGRMRARLVNPRAALERPQRGRANGRTRLRAPRSLGRPHAAGDVHLDPVSHGIHSGNSNEFVFIGCHGVPRVFHLLLRSSLCELAGSAHIVVLIPTSTGRGTPKPGGGSLAQPLNIIVIT